jgi:hypothetical protein
MIQNSNKCLGKEENPSQISNSINTSHNCEVPSSLQFTTSADSKMKFKKISNNKKLYCSGKNCRRSFNTKEALEEHEKTHKDTIFTCPHEKCARQFNFYFNFQVLIILNLLETRQNPRSGSRKPNKTVKKKIFGPQRYSL